ncbi:MAG: Fur family transcriptional regulator [Acidimicrobiia bacterium]
MLLLPILNRLLTVSRIRVVVTIMTGGFTDPITQLLRDSGVQVTAQRVAILRAVSEHPHTTADELADQVRGQLGTISRQAVYDSLSVLVDKNLLRRIQPAGSAARYEDRVGDNHHHMICRDCRTMHDVDCAVDRVPCLSPSESHGFELDEAEVIYWGRCPSCKENNPVKETRSNS